MAKIFHSKGYKVIMGYVYGWGASAVIIGALFKIMHFPGAGLILSVGMIVEAAIFFLSAFEPAMEHYDWSRVFPVLGKSGEVDKQNVVANDVVATSAETTRSKTSVTNNIDLGIDKSDVTRLKEGISKIAETADTLAEMKVNVPAFTEKIAQASASFGDLNDKTRQVGEVLENSVKGFSDGCNEINRILQESTEGLTAQIKANCEKLATNMGQSAENFNSLSKIMDEQMLHVKNQAENYTQQISAVSKNIGALNALYELQINETKDCLESFRGMQGDMGEMLENVSLSLDSAKLFKQEAQQLANNVASLNSVYGNMLSVVNNN